MSRLGRLIPGQTFRNSQSQKGYFAGIILLILIINLICVKGGYRPDGKYYAPVRQYAEAIHRRLTSSCGHWAEKSRKRGDLVAGSTIVGKLAV